MTYSCMSVLCVYKMLINYIGVPSFTSITQEFIVLSINESVNNNDSNNLQSKCTQALRMCDLWITQCVSCGCTVTLIIYSWTVITHINWKLPLLNRCTQVWFQSWLSMQTDMICFTVSFLLLWLEQMELCQDTQT